MQARATDSWKHFRSGLATPAGSNLLQHKGWDEDAENCSICNAALGRRAGLINVFAMTCGAPAEQCAHFVLFEPEPET